MQAEINSPLLFEGGKNSSPHRNKDKKNSKKLQILPAILIITKFKTEVISTNFHTGFSRANSLF